MNELDLATWVYITQQIGDAIRMDCQTIGRRRDHPEDYLWLLRNNSISECDIGVWILSTLFLRRRETHRAFPVMKE